MFVFVEIFVVAQRDLIKADGSLGKVQLAIGLNESRVLANKKIVQSTGTQAKYKSTLIFSIFCPQVGIIYRRIYSTIRNKFTFIALPPEFLSIHSM